MTSWMQAIPTAIIVISSMGSLCGRPMDSTEEVWIAGGYSKAIERASALAPDQKASTGIQNLLRGSMWNWRELPAFQEVRAVVRKLCGECEHVRLEIGNENEGSYRVLWFVRQENMPLLLTNIVSGSSLQTFKLDPTAWHDLHDRVTNGARALADCPSDLKVSDGSTYFVAFGHKGQVEQFAVYGLQLEGLVDEVQNQEAPTLLGCKEVVRGILRTARAMTAG